jgi:hypothetical protein
MLVDGLPIPGRLITMIDRGLWPSTEAESRRQNSHSLVTAERIHLFAPEEDKLYLMAPPFHTVATIRQSQSMGKFWDRFAAPEGISPELSIDIGDFGLGSDSPILLDYRVDRNNPTVIRLKWRKAVGLPNIWVRCADNFDAFADMLGLEALAKPFQNPPPKNLASREARS